MLEDTDRLRRDDRAGAEGGRGRDRITARATAREVDFAGLVRECMDLARTRHHLAARARCASRASAERRAIDVRGDAEELRTAVSNLLDNAIKYSGERRGRVGGSRDSRTRSTWCCGCATAAWEFPPAS